jgi:hypothetical protein
VARSATDTAAVLARRLDGEGGDDPALSQFPQNATVTPKSGSGPTVVPIDGASTEFACK